MNRSLHLQENNFAYLAAVAVLAASVGTALLVPYLKLTLQRRATDLLTSGQAAEKAGNIKRAEVDYQLAGFFDSGNRKAMSDLANLRIAQGNIDAAISTLRQLPKGESGLEIAQLQRRSGRLNAALLTLNDAILDKAGADLLAEKSRVLLEEWRVSEATEAARQAVSYGLTDDQASLQLGLCLAVDGKITDLPGITATVTDPAALGDLQKAQQGKSQLAAVLYARGLLRTAERVITSEQTVSASEYRFLGQIEATLAVNDPKHWTAARDYLEKATHTDPAKLEGHQQLKQAYEKTGDSDKAALEQELIDRLVSGKV